MFLEHESLYGVRGEVPEDPEFMVPFGKANIIREGKDVTIVTCLLEKCVYDAIAAAEVLENSWASMPRWSICEDLEPARHGDRRRVGEGNRTRNRRCARDGAPAAPALKSPRRFTKHAFDSLDAPVVRVLPPRSISPMPYNKHARARVAAKRR